jgi:hypothetical protein
MQLIKTRVSKKKQKTLMIGTLVVELLIVILLLAVVSSQSGQFGPPKPAPIVKFGPIDVQDRVALAGNTGMVIPKSASGLHGVINGDQTIRTHMRFDIPASDLNEALKNTGCSGALSNKDIRAQVQEYPQRDWWTPGQAQTYASCNAAQEDVTQLIFVDMTDPQHYIVYVIASTK